MPTTRTKIEINPAVARRVNGLDDLARILFPDNRNHQRAFVAIWIEIKYADKQFLDSSMKLTSPCDLSPRTLEIVRAKLKKLGLIKRISHFNPTHGHRSGWTFAPLFCRSLDQLSSSVRQAKMLPGHEVDERKDRASIFYI